METSVKFGQEISAQLLLGMEQWAEHGRFNSFSEEEQLKFGYPQPTSTNKNDGIGMDFIIGSDNASHHGG